jgi:hypothetical protein
MQTDRLIEGGAEQSCWSPVSAFDDGCKVLLKHHA